MPGNWGTNLVFSRRLLCGLSGLNTRRSRMKKGGTSAHPAARLQQMSHFNTTLPCLICRQEYLELLEEFRFRHFCSELGTAQTGLRTTVAAKMAGGGEHLPPGRIKTVGRKTICFRLDPKTRFWLRFFFPYPTVCHVCTPSFPSAQDERPPDNKTIANDNHGQCTPTNGSPCRHHHRLMKLSGTSRFFSGAV